MLDFKPAGNAPGVIGVGTGRIMEEKPILSWQDRKGNLVVVKKLGMICVITGS